MSRLLSTHIWENSRQKGTKLLLLLALADNADTETAECFPGIKYLSKKTRLDPRTVQRLLRALETEGEINIATNGHNSRSNLYRLLTTPEPQLDLKVNDSAKSKGGVANCQGGGGQLPWAANCQGGGGAAIPPGRQRTSSATNSGSKDSRSGRSSSAAITGSLRTEASLWLVVSTRRRKS